MPPVNAMPLGATMEDRLALVLQRIEKKKDEEKAKPPPPKESGDKGGAGGPSGGASGPSSQAPGAKEARGDDYRPPSSDADRETAARDRVTGHAPAKVRADTDPQPANEETERRRTETHLQEGRPVPPRVSERERDPAKEPGPTGGLPTYQALHDQQRETNRREFDDSMKRSLASMLERAEREKKPTPVQSDPFARNNLFANTVDCRDCHPDTKKNDLGPDLSALTRSFPTQRRGSDFGPKPVDHDAIRSELDRGFESAVKDLDPTARAEEAQRYALRMAGDDLPQARKYERDFRVRESQRVEEASKAKDLAPESRARMQQLSHELMRRPMSGATQDFVSELERTPVDRLSHRDSKAALSMIRAHRPADASTYDPVTGVQPGHDDLFYSRREQSRLFDPKKYTPQPKEDPLARFQRSPLLGGEKCYDCHPDKKDDFSSLSLSGFGAPRDFGQRLQEIQAKERKDFDAALTNKLALDHPSVRPGTQAYDDLKAKYTEEDQLRRRLELSNGDPRQRLKVAPDQMTDEQRRVYDDHVANFRLDELEKKIRPHVTKLDAEYTQKGWGDDSPFYGVDREAFLADVASKDIDKVSHYDRFRALDSIDSYKKDNPELFDHDPDSFQAFRERVDLHEASQLVLDPAQLTQRMGSGEKCYDCHPDPKRHDFSLDALRPFGDRRLAESKTSELWKAFRAEDPAPSSDLYFRGEKEMREAGLGEEDIAERMRVAREDPNNPIPYLKKPMEELSDEKHRQVTEDYTRFSVEQLEKKMRKSLVDNVGREVERLDRTFDRILRDQGVVGDLADAIKNNLGTKDGWLIDSELGSNAVVRTISEAYAARRGVENLANFEGTHEEFVKAYQDRVTNLRDKIQAVPRHIDKFNKSQSNWVEGISDIASVGVALTAAAAAPVTGGASLLVGAAAGALTKVGTKGLDAITGSGEYDGNVALDLLKGGINGLSGTGTNMLAREAAKRMLASQAMKLTAGQSVSMLTRAGIWGTTTVGEGALDGYLVGSSSSLLDGKSFSESQMDGLRGAAFGAILNPLAQGGTNTLGRLWRGKARVPDDGLHRVPDADALDAPKAPRAEGPEGAKLKLSSLADDVVAKLDGATKEIDDALGRWPDTKQAKGHRQRVEKMADDLKLAKKLLEQNPTDANATAAQEFLTASEKARRLASEYANLEKPRRPPGQLTPDEEAAGRKAVEAYTANEKTTRQAFLDAYQESQQKMYESIRKTAGIGVSRIDDARPGTFDRNPVDEVEKLKLPADETPNRAYAELEIDGVRKPLGPRRSGGGPEEAVHGNPYEAETRPLEAVPGQHNKSRMNDSEVRLLGLVNEELAKVPPGTAAKLRIFTELPPCPSCQRMMAKFRSDYPNVEIEVFHQ